MRETDQVKKALDKARREGLVTDGVGVNLGTAQLSSPADVPLSEDDFLRRVLLLAKAKEWLVHHVRPAKTNKGWRTAVQGDAGFPDLVLARNGVVIFAELKSDKGKLTPSQDAWLDALAPRNGNAPIVCLWRPADWQAIEEALA